MKNRIKEIISDESINAAQFASEVGIAPSSLHHIISGRNNPSLDVIQKILSRYHQINAEWLISGVGKKYKTLVQGKLFDIPIESADNQDKNKGTYLEKEHSVSEENNKLENKDVQKLIKSSSEVESITVFYKDGRFKQYFSV